VTDPTPGNSLPNSPPPQAHPVALSAVFASTFFELVGNFMLIPWLLLRLADLGASNTTAGLFAAVDWLGIFIVTPFASSLVARFGHRRLLWLSATVALASALAFALPYHAPLWFGLMLVCGLAGGLRWVLAEALVAEFAPPAQRGRYVALFATLVGACIVAGPALLAWIGPHSQRALGLIVLLLALGLAASLAIPRLPTASRNADTRHGVAGLWQALCAHPVVMLAGLVGGFFEVGLSSVLPLYGLSLGLPAASAAALVAASGAGSAIVVLPMGLHR
jgi:MFS family permease